MKIYKNNVNTKLEKYLTSNIVFKEWIWFFKWLGKKSQRIIITSSIIGLLIGFTDFIVLWIFKDLFSDGEQIINIYLVVLFLIINTLIRIKGSKYVLNGAARLTTEASKTIFNSTIDMNFEDFDNHNSSFYVSRIGYAGILGDNLLINLINLTSLIGSALIITCGALYLTGWNGGIAISLTLFGYYIINKQIRANTKNSKLIAKKKSKELISIIQESVLNGKEIRINEYEEQYVSRFSEIDTLLRQAIAKNYSTNFITKYSVEGIGLIIICMLIEINKGIGIETAVVLGLTFVRLLPVSQGLFSILNNTLFYSYTFEGLRDLDKLHNQSKNKTKNYIEKVENVDFIIDLKNVTYNYNKNKGWEGLNVNFRLLENKTTVITGDSGGGKSTLLDLICGLRAPVNGSIKVNSKYLKKTKKYNLEKIDYIYLGQNGNLFDCSLLENIIGKDSKINHSRLEKVLDICSLKNVLIARDNGINAKVGEFGKQFSGGQVQRILLARSLYGNSKIIILDEATSALDFVTSKKVFGALIKFTKEEGRSLLVVTHNLNITSNFDEHWEMNDGRVTKK